MLGSRTTIVSLHATLPYVKGSNFPRRLLGVVNLYESGYTICEVAFAHGVPDVPHIPYMINIDCDKSNIEFRRGFKPLLLVTEWEEVEFKTE